MLCFSCVRMMPVYLLLYFGRQICKQTTERVFNGTTLHVGHVQHERWKIKAMTETRRDHGAMGRYSQDRI